MTDYYQHHYASNSDLKRLVSRYVEGREQPDLEEVFTLGTLIHAALLENHKANENHKDYKLAQTMAKTVMNDPLCRQLILIRDFKREYEFYRQDVYGIKARAKMDGYSRVLSTVLEYKGLSVLTDKAFMEAVYNFDYDQGAAWYLDTSGARNLLVVAVSKKNPRKMFKLLIDRNHDVYKSGLVKVKRAVQLWKEFFEPCLN